MKLRFIQMSGLIALFLATQSVALAQSTSAQSEAKQTVLIVFETIDKNGNGNITIEELSEMSSSIFLSMDYDDNNEVSPEEFTEWDFGLLDIAAKEGQSQTYNTAKKILFAMRDLDADGIIDESENRATTLSDFTRADIDYDAAPTKKEYLTSYTPILVFKAALKPTGSEQ